MDSYALLSPVSRCYYNLKSPGKFQGVRFLCYHGIVNDIESLHPIRRSVSIEITEFKNHLACLEKEKYKIISMPRALEILLSKRSNKEGKYVCLTFDDGYMDNYTEAWPVLKEFGCSAHFFIVSDFVGKTFSETINGQNYKREYMTEEQILSFINEGGTIGSHGADHSVLPELTYSSILSQAVLSKNKLENLTGLEISTFAYPSGMYESKSIKALQDAGYFFGFNIGYGYASVQYH